MASPACVRFFRSSAISRALAVTNYMGDPISIETGIGFGPTPNPDNLADKPMFSSELNRAHGLFGE